MCQVRLLAGKLSRVSDPESNVSWTSQSGGGTQLQTGLQVRYTCSNSNAVQKIGVAHGDLVHAVRVYRAFQWCLIRGA